VSAPGLTLTRLRLVEFRNYEALDLALDGRPVCLFGDNGAGKTNLLEAVSLLGPGRGLRAAQPAQIRRREAAPPGAWAVLADAEGPDGAMTLSTGVDPGAPSRRLARIDGEPASQTALARLLPMLGLTPREDRLWAGPRGDRLKFFDRLVLSGAPEHGRAANAYEKAMRQRQRLLDEAEEGRSPDLDWLDALEREMAASGAAMAAARLEALARLQAEINERPDNAFPKADLALHGEIEDDLAAGSSATEAEARNADTLKSLRRRDGAAGRTLTGPHRSDFTARHRDKAMPAEDCSTGEQKALLSGLALAQAAARKAVAGRSPVLLLDEACAHLDAARREGLAEAVLDLGAQSFMTGVDAGLFAPFGAQAQRFSVAGGLVRPAD